MIISKNIIKSTVGRFFAPCLLKSGHFQDARIILMYHRVVENLPSNLHDPAMYVTRRTLEMHIKEISRFFEVVPLESILSSKKGRLCAFTFDDGWLDNFQSAYPVFRKHVLPATIFIPVSMVGTSRQFWFQVVWDLAAHAVRTERESVFKRCFDALAGPWNASELNTNTISALISNLKKFDARGLDALVEDACGMMEFELNGSRHVVNWDEVSSMSRDSISFGSHGLNHFILPVLDSGTKRNEIVESFDILRSRAVRFTPFFSYPDGKLDEESLSLVSRAGYIGAVSTRNGYNGPRSLPYLLNRVGIHEYISSSPDLFWFRILQLLYPRVSGR